MPSVNLSTKDYKAGFIQNISYTNTANGTNWVLNNPNPFAVEVMISAQAGNGEVNTTLWNQQGEHYRYYNDGRTGTAITIYNDGVLQYTLAGGNGNLGNGRLFQKREWRGTTKGNSDWHGVDAPLYLAQSGDNITAFLTLKAGKSIKIVYGTGYGAFKGSHSVSIIY